MAQFPIKWMLWYDMNANRDVAYLRKVKDQLRQRAQFAIVIGLLQFGHYSS